MDSSDLAGAKQRFEQTQAVARETDAKPLLPAALGGMGEVLMQQGKPNEARKAYEQALAIDKENELEARLAAAEIELKSGSPADAAKNLAALEKYATSKGYVLIAQKAGSNAKSRIP
jgi:tetratricopeptide (TPR) repeat protein